MLAENLKMIISREGIDARSLVFDGECPVFEKFDEYIPAELLCDAFALDRLSPEEVIKRFTEDL